MRVRTLLLLACVACGSDQAHRVPPEGGRAPASDRRAVRPFRIGEPDVVLLVTDSTNGVLEPCNCASGMTGGFSRRSGLIRSYRAAFPDLLLVDTGDAFRLGHPRDPRNAFVLRAYREMGYDALVLADHEWSTAPSALSELVAKGPPEFLSTTANLKGGSIPVSRVVKRERGDVKLAFLSDTPRASPPLAPDVAQRLAYAAPARLAAEVAKLKREGRVVIVASHGLDAEVRETARSSGADIVLHGHYRSGGVVPQRVSKPPILPVGDFEYVNVVAMKVKNGAVVELEYRREIADERWPRDEKLWHTYEAYTQVALRHATATKLKDGMVFASSASCGGCHESQFASYQATAHAHAYDTLLRVGREGDPDCLSCHTTGFVSKAGFESMRTTPHLANVNCQDCHAFSMKEHDVKGFKAPRMEPASCTRCHTGTTDPTFDFAKHRAKAGCRPSPKAPLREAEVRGPRGLMVR